MTTIEDFPDVNYASEDGLLALGGDLSPERLLVAYRKGIFPWYNPGEPILWWSPNPRCVLFPNKFRPSKSLQKSIRRQKFRFSVDQAFKHVIRQCAAPRAAGPGTWITADMMHAYIELHKRGYAHSVETWQQDKLVGGLYGIALGKIFFGESMFSTVSDSSKAALDYLVSSLVSMDYHLIDCQITSPHLLSLGAEEISRSEFVNQLDLGIGKENRPGFWVIPDTE
jgi:leucyl/phenylalanyl-tRNA--protein transferase